MPKYGLDLFAAREMKAMEKSSKIYADMANDLEQPIEGPLTKEQITQFLYLFSDAVEHFSDATQNFRKRPPVFMWKFAFAPGELEAISEEGIIIRESYPSLVSNIKKLVALEEYQRFSVNPEKKDKRDIYARCHAIEKFLREAEAVQKKHEALECKFNDYRKKIIKFGDTTISKAESIVLKTVAGLGLAGFLAVQTLSTLNSSTTRQTIREIKYGWEFAKHAIEYVQKELNGKNKSYEEAAAKAANERRDSTNQMPLGYISLINPDGSISVEKIDDSETITNAENNTNKEITHTADSIDDVVESNTANDGQAADQETSSDVHANARNSGDNGGY